MDDTMLRTRPVPSSNRTESRVASSSAVPTPEKKASWYGFLSRSRDEEPQLGSHATPPQLTLSRDVSHLQDEPKDEIKIEMELEAAKGEDENKLHPGHHPRWDAGAADWATYRTEGVWYRQKDDLDHWGEAQFARAKEDLPLLDDDAVMIRASGEDIAPEGYCIRTVRALRWNANSSVSLAGQEKLVGVIQVIQVFGLVVSLSEEWKLPGIWRKTMNWSRAFIGLELTDKLEWTPRGSSESAMALVLIPVAMALLFVLYLAWLKKRLKTRERNVLVLIRLCGGIAELAYLPVVLAAFRIVFCKTKGQLGLDVTCSETTGACSSSIQCSSAMGLIRIAFAGITLLIFCVAMPYFAYRKVIVFDKKHERFLQTREAEYLLGLSTKWEDFHFWIFSGYRRQAAYYKLRLMALHTLLAAWAVYTSFQVELSLDESYTTDATVFGNSIKKAQSIGVLAVLGVEFVLFHVQLCPHGRGLLVLSFPYRQHETTRMVWILKLHLLLVVMYGTLIACDLENSFLNPSTLVNFLKIQGIISFCIFVVATLEALYQRWRKRHWQITPKRLRPLKQSFEGQSLLRALREAKALLARYQLVKYEFVDLELVEKHVSEVQQHLRAAEEASEAGLDKFDLSLFILPMREVLEDLVDLRRSSKDCSYLRYKPHKERSETWAPLELRQNMPVFRARMDARDRTHIFMAPRMKRILLKLLAIRVFIGDRRFEFDSAVTDETSSPSSPPETAPAERVPSALWGRTSEGIKGHLAAQPKRDAILPNQEAKSPPTPPRRVPEFARTRSMNAKSPGIGASNSLMHTSSM